MKTYNHLMEQFLSEENYKLAVYNATKHKGGKKRKYESAHYYRDHMEELMPEILDYAKNFENAPHTPKMIYDGVRRKQRTIIVPTMKEQIVHHMIVNVMKPIFMKGMYEHSYGSIPKRGAHLAKKQIKKWIKRDPKNTKYILKLDIKKYFDSIPHGILKYKLMKIIKDRNFLHFVLFRLIDVMPNGRGIPIGFYTSQWLANWYLQDLDHRIKERFRAKYYVRYMDDIVIFGPDSWHLHKIKDQIEDYLAHFLGLEIKSNWQVFLFDTGYNSGRCLDFMGFKFYRNKITLRKVILIKARRKAERISNKKINIHSCRQMLSYLGWLSVTDTYSYYEKYIKSHVKIQCLKRYEGNWQRKRNKEVLNGMV